jgi:hypothetical protein
MIEMKDLLEDLDVRVGVNIARFDKAQHSQTRRLVAVLATGRVDEDVGIN